MELSRRYLMNTVVKNWQIVTVFNKNEELGNVLFGTVVSDSTYRYVENDYVCSSAITHFNTNTNIIKTKTGSIYQLLGEGIGSEVQFNDFEKLRSGLSPQEINFIHERDNVYYH